MARRVAGAALLCDLVVPALVGDEVERELEVLELREDGVSALPYDSEALASFLKDLPRESRPVSDKLTPSASTARRPRPCATCISCSSASSPYAFAY